MTWNEPRPSARAEDRGVDAPVRQRAPSEDAKWRVDENTRPGPRRLPGWAAPALAALAVAGVIGGVAAIARDDSGAPPGEADAPSGSSVDREPASPTEPEPEPDLSGTYRGTASMKFVNAFDGSVTTDSEEVRGKVVCDEVACSIEVEHLTDRFRRPISVPASGGTDRFSRPAQGGDPCNRDAVDSGDQKADGWVRLGAGGLRWKLVYHPDQYSDCPGGVFLGGAVSEGSATRD